MYCLMYRHVGRREMSCVDKEKLSTCSNNINYFFNLERRVLLSGLQMAFRFPLKQINSRPLFWTHNNDDDEDHHRDGDDDDDEDNEKVNSKVPCINGRLFLPFNDYSVCPAG